MSNVESVRVDAPATGSLRSAFLWWVIWIVWIPLFTSPVLDLLRAHPPLIWLLTSIAGAVVFFGFYLWTTWQSARTLASTAPRAPSSEVALWTPVAIMILLAVGLTLVDGHQWGDLFIYTSTAAGGRLPTRRAAVTITGLVALTIVGVSIRSGIAAAVSPAVFVAIPGFVVIAVIRSITISQQLRAAREEMARVAAAAEERLRIARDLHDLLGHNLSMIALKSELARRLIPVAPERAAIEIGDVERVARTALQEVREAVAGYRQPTLVTELAGAREILTAAGIGYRYEGGDSVSRDLPVAVDATLAWTVREGVTNVIRHSRARTCTIRIERNAQQASIEVADDGVTADVQPSAPAGASYGNGLRGLGERVDVLGGHVESGPRTTGGFRLYVTIPLKQTERGSTAPAPEVPTLVSIPLVATTSVADLVDGQGTEEE